MIRTEHKVTQECGEPKRLTRAKCACGWHGVWYATEHFARVSGERHAKGCPEGQRKEMT